MENITAFNKCLLPFGIIQQVSSYLGSYGPITPRYINALNSLINALVLYDGIVVCPYSQHELSFSSLRKIKEDPVLTYLLDESESGVFMLDPVDKIINSPTFISYLESWRNKTFRSFDYTWWVQMKWDSEFVFKNDCWFTDEPNIEIKLSKMEMNALFQKYWNNRYPEDIIQNIYNKPDDKFLFKEVKAIFEKGFPTIAREYFFIIEQLRKFNSFLITTGFLLPYDFVPFWQYERNLFRSSLHSKVDEIEKTIVASHLGEYREIDVSPLVVIALDNARTRADIPSVILNMRKDFRELRSIGTDFALALTNAKSYSDMSDVLYEWDRMWTVCLNRIKSHKEGNIPLLGKMFSWDIDKDFTYPNIVINSAKTLLGEAINLKIVKRLSIIFQVERNFLSSASIEKQLKRLFPY